MTFIWLKNDTLIVLAGPVVFELREGIGCVSTAPTKSGASVGAPLATITCGVRGWAGANWVEVVRCW